jgi:hypothetical protein
MQEKLIRIFVLMQNYLQKISPSIIILSTKLESILFVTYMVSKLVDCAEIFRREFFRQLLEYKEYRLENQIIILQINTHFSKRSFI